MSSSFLRTLRSSYVVAADAVGVSCVVEVLGAAVVIVQSASGLYVYVAAVYCQHTVTLHAGTT